MLHRFRIGFLNSHCHRQLHARLDSIVPFFLGQYDPPRGFVSYRISPGRNPTFAGRLLKGELQEIFETLQRWDAFRPNR